jgi:uncharacterized protein
MVKKKVKSDEENMELCSGCGAKCCKYVAIEIDAPEDLDDFENIRWYVAHKNVQVYVEEDGTWNVEFLTPCEHLDENNLCDIYEKRPEICKEYTQDQCTYHNEYEEDYTFKTVEDVDNYIEKEWKKNENKS